MDNRKVIYLDDAIDALESKKDKKAKGDIGGFYNKIIQNDIDTLMQLPSAQPDLDEWCTDCKEYDPKRHSCPRYTRVINEALKNARLKQKTGEWEIYIISMLDGEGCRCSECGSEGVPYWNFCPNCGADMRGEAE
jgi:hypothetical protein